MTQTEYILNFLKNYHFLGNSGYAYVVFALVFVLLLAALHIFRKIILTRLKKASKKTKNELDDILVAVFENIGPFSYPLLAFYISLRYINVSGSFAGVFSIVFVLVLIYETIKAFSKIFDFYLSKHLKKLENENDRKGTKSVMGVVKIIVVGALWVLAGMLVLSNLGFNINSLMAGLGIGGIAVALAVQNVLGDLLSSVSIYLDKPFKAGDFIVIGDDNGVVEKIGIKTTRIKTLLGQELIISNKELTSVRVNNFKKLKKRRDVFKIGVVYDTDESKLKKIPSIIEKAVKADKLLEFDRCNLAEFGDFSLNFETVYYIDTGDYNSYMNAKEGILLRIFSEFKKEGIEFAYPTQEIVVKK